MKKQSNFLLILAALFAMILSACGGTAAVGTETSAGANKPLASLVQFTGVIDAIDGNQWTVNGQVITVDPAVVRDGTFKIGDTVKVEGEVQADGTLVVTRVELPTDASNSNDDNGNDDNSNSSNSNDDNSNSSNSNDDNSNSSNSNEDNSNGRGLDDDNGNDDNSNGGSNSNDDNSTGGGNSNGDDDDNSNGGSNSNDDDSDDSNGDDDSDDSNDNG